MGLTDAAYTPPKQSSSGGGMPGFGGQYQPPYTGSNPTVANSPVNPNTGLPWNFTPTPYYSTGKTASAPAPKYTYTSPLEQAYAYYTSTPEYILAQQQIANRTAQRNQSLSAITGGYGAQRSAMQDAHRIALERLALEEANFLIDLEASRRQPMLISELDRLANEAFLAQVAYIDQLLGYSTADYQRAAQYLADQLGFVGREHGLATDRAQFTADLARRDTLSDATTRGAVATQGFIQSQGDIATQLAQAIAEADLTRDTRTTDINKQRGDLETDYQREQSGLTTQRRQAELDREAEWKRANEERTRAEERIRQLENMARDFGLRREEMEAQLRKGLAALGIEQQMSVNGLMDMMNQDAIAGSQLAMQALQAAAQMQGQFPGAKTKVGGPPVPYAPGGQPLYSTR